MKYYKADNKKHAYGNYDKLSQELLRELDKLAQLANQELLITSGYRAGDKGQHGLGLAVDVVPSRAVPLMELFLLAERFCFKGIGIYPKWSNGSEVTGGLHLDLRSVDVGARWIGLGSGKQQPYVALTLQNLKAQGLV